MTAYLVMGTGYWAVVDDALKSKRSLANDAEGKALVNSGFYKTLDVPPELVDRLPEATVDSALGQFEPQTGLTDRTGWTR